MRSLRARPKSPSFPEAQQQWGGHSCPPRACGGQECPPHHFSTSKGVSGFRGFTLLEAIVSVAIMAIGLVAVIEAYGAAMRLSLQDEYLTTATFLARGKMEEVLKESGIAEGKDEGDFGEEFADYTWTVEIADSEIEGLAAVTVTVYWNVAGIDDELVLTSAAPYSQTEQQNGGGATGAGGAAP